MANFKITVVGSHENSAMAAIGDFKTNYICRKDQLRDVIDTCLDNLLPDNICDMPDLHNSLPIKVVLFVKKHNGEQYEITISKEV